MLKEISSRLNNTLKWVPAKKHAGQILGVILGGFIFLTVFVLLLPVSALDIEVSEELQEHHTPLLDGIMNAISWFGQTQPAVAGVCCISLVLLIAKYKKEALYMMLVLLSSVVTYGIKIMVNRPRPGDNLVRIIVHTRHQSFPSGHTVFYIVFFGYLLFLAHHYRWWKDAIRKCFIGFCLTMIFSVPFSRVYLGAHWFTDVCGGFLIGTACLTGLLYSYLSTAKT